MGALYLSLPTLWSVLVNFEQNIVGCSVISKANMVYNVLFREGAGEGGEGGNYSSSCIWSLFG